MADNNKKKYIKYEDTTYILEDSRIPDPSSADNGKVLGIVNGAYVLKQEQGGGGGGSGAVTSVNGKTGAVTLSASDVGAYTKPASGVPKTDLASGVQASLSKADTALQPRELSYVTPEQFGAVGDGIADDTQAFQSALNAGKAVLCKQNAVYSVTNSLQISGGTILDLNGSTLHTDRDIPIIVENQNSAAVSNVTFRNGYFSGTRTNDDESAFTNQCGIRIRSYHSNYENLRFDNFNYGLYLDARASGTGTLVENRILNSKFANCLNAAIYNETGTKVTDGILDNVKIGGTGYDHGILLKQAGGWQVSNLHIYGSGISVGAEFRNCDCTLLNNVFIGGNHSTAGLILHDYSHVELSNSVIQANTARTNGLWAQTSTAQRWQMKPILLSNVTFSSNAASGSEIFAIRGRGDIQTVNVVYNDQKGAFVDSRVEPTEEDPSYVVSEAKVDEFGYNIYSPIDGGKELVNNKDFNEIIDCGNYVVNKSAVATSAINIPEATLGRLVVSNPTGDNGTYRYRKQEYQTTSTTNSIFYFRYGTSSDSGETWTWRPWVQIRDNLSSGIPITSNSDFNNFTAPFSGMVRTTTIAASITNIPVRAPGRLFVMDMTNGYARGDASIYIRQFYIPYTTAQRVYSRYAVYSKGAWTWYDWVGLNELPAVTASDNGKFLRVVSGAWAAQAVPSAESNSFGGGS